MTSNYKHLIQDLRSADRSLTILCDALAIGYGQTESDNREEDYPQKRWNNQAKDSTLLGLLAGVHSFHDGSRRDFEIWMFKCSERCLLCD